jgi:hypothetical protein
MQVHLVLNFFAVRLDSLAAKVKLFFHFFRNFDAQFP